MNWILKNKKKLEITAFLSLLARKCKRYSILLASFDNKKTRTLLVVLFLAFLLFHPFGHVSHAAVELVDGCKVEWNPKTWIQCTLIGVLQFVGYLFAIAATLFAWVITPDNVSGPNGLLNKQAIKDVWIMVRDLMNMTFILVLLFSAFCTIFQYDKWGFKKVWLNILINALLVNFSYPIARFIIDISNVAFYYFVNNLFSTTGTTVVTGSTIFSALASTSKIAEILTPRDFTVYSAAYLIIQIIFVFTFGMSLLIVAALFVVRLVALSLLIMFSPIGFVGYIFPSWSKYADEWWNNLFSYSFFAPIMIFVISIALRISQQIGASNFNSMAQYGGVNSGPDQSLFIANVAFYFIPLIILWVGIGVAKSMSIKGAAEVTGKVKSWGGSLGSYMAYGHPIARGVKEGFKEKSRYNKFNKWWKSDSSIEAAIKGGIVGAGEKDGLWGGTVKGWQKVSDKDVSEKIKEYKDKNKTIDDIAKDLDSKFSTDRMAAAKYLMDQKGALNDPKRMAAALKVAGSNKSMRGKILDNAGDFASNDDFNAGKLNEILMSTTSDLSGQEKVNMTKKIKGMIGKENVIKLIELEQMAEHRNGRTDEQIYKEHLGDLDADGLAKQKGLHDKIETDANFNNYVTSEVKTDPGFHQEVFKKMKKENRNKWADAGLNP